MPLEQNCSYLRIRLHGNGRLFTSLILVAAGCRVLLLPPPDPLPKGRGSLAAHAGGFAYLNRLCQTYRRRDAFAGGLLYCAIVGFIYHYFKEQWQCCQFRIQHFDWHVCLRSVAIVSAGICDAIFHGFYPFAGCDAYACGRHIGIVPIN